jgi:hypothetical protein
VACVSQVRPRHCHPSAVELCLQQDAERREGVARKADVGWAPSARFPRRAQAATQRRWVPCSSTPPRCGHRWPFSTASS